MSAFIKQIRETFKRRYGYDPALEPGRRPPGPKKSIEEILRECPGMILEPGPGEEQPEPERVKH